jgi:hypothetical protein
MKKSLFVIIFSLTFLFGKSEVMIDNDTVLVGRARNAKLGAVIMSANNEVYYVDDLKSWDSIHLDKEVRVSGKLIIKKMKRTKKISTNITSPEIKVIKNAKVEVLKIT